MELPEKFVDMLSRLPGFENAAEALAGTEPSVAVRFNPAKTAPNLSGCDLVPWEPLGLYIAQRPAFTFDPDLYYGRYYVQDPSSMIVGEAVRRIVARTGSKQPLRYLDACAAPGGKTTSAMANLPEGSFVLANEYDPARTVALVENLERWGYPRYAVARGDARALAKAGELFDIVATDVPCSGEGMMRKNETAVSQWSPALIESCAALQRQIVEAVYATLRPGGYLIYSTCTFNTTENEGNCRWICEHLGAETVDLGLSDYPGVLPAIGCDIPAARFVPGRVRGEGQFIAVFRKPADQAGTTPRFSALRKTSRLPEWLDDGFVGLTARDGSLFAVATDVAPLVSHLSSTLNVIVPGIQVAYPKGRDMSPAHALAASLARSADAFLTAEVDYQTAISFLRGEALRLDANYPKGHIIITHENTPLGFVKNIGSRANNLLPANRRIRSSHAPETRPYLLH